MRCVVWRVALVAGGLTPLVMMHHRPLFAQESAPSASSAPSTPGQEAARAFAEGESAFRAGDYARAAQAFQRAYALAAHPSASWNAAQAWYRAGELVRAANLYDRYLREAPAGSPDRDQATQALVGLSKQLAKIRVFGPGLTDIHVDDTPLENSVLYVAPGQHAIWARTAEGKDVRVVREVVAGSETNVVLEPPPAPPQPSATVSAPPPAPLIPTPKPAESGNGFRTLPPWIVYTGAGLTLVAAGLTTWQGLATKSARDDYDASPSQALLDDGRSKQDRTNALFYVTVGLGVVTGAAAIWMVDWKQQGKSMTVGLGAGTAYVRFIQ